MLEGRGKKLLPIQLFNETIDALHGCVDASDFVSLLNLTKNSLGTCHEVLMCFFAVTTLHGVVKGHITDCCHTSVLA